MDGLRIVQVHYILVSYLGGRILTIFFKKDFSIEIHGTQLLIDALALGVSMAGIKIVPLGVVVALLELLLLLYKCFEYRKDEMIKTLVISFSIYVVLYVNLYEVVFDCGTLVLATTQFLRKPQGLKEQLREIRINCGPVYVISMCSGLRFHPIQDLTWDLPSMATKLAVIASVIAAVFFRPDNNQTLKLFLRESLVPRTDNRRRTHGYLMFSSFVFTFAKVLSTTMVPILTYGRLVLGSAVFFGVLNIVLYLTYKYSRKWN